jgi:hypothetical protein
MSGKTARLLKKYGWWAVAFFVVKGVVSLFLIYKAGQAIVD